MARQRVTLEEGAELERLYIEQEKATAQAIKSLQEHGMGSTEFIEADKKIGVIWRRIREILEITGQHWMG